MHLKILDYGQKSRRNKTVPTRLGYEEKVSQHKYCALCKLIQELFEKLGEGQRFLILRIATLVPDARIECEPEIKQFL